MSMTGMNNINTAQQPLEMVRQSMPLIGSTARKGGFFVSTSCSLNCMIE